MQLFLRHLPVGHFDLKAISYISCTDSDTSCIFTVGIIWLLASFGMVLSVADDLDLLILCPFRSLRLIYVILLFCFGRLEFAT